MKHAVISGIMIRNQGANSGAIVGNGNEEGGGEKNKEKGMKKLSVKEEKKENFFSSTFGGTWCLRLKKVSAIRGDFVLGFWGLIRFVGGSSQGDIS